MIAFLSTYPPRECGIATFTQDLINELKKIKLINQPKVIAINNDKYEYNQDVIYELDQFDRSDYIRLAKQINISNVDLLVIEHEYGIYGGNRGEFLLDFINHLDTPFVTTLHTVLSKPDTMEKYILTELGKKSKAIVTMANNTIPLLHKIYGINTEKIVVIPHGVPEINVEPIHTLREKYSLTGRKIVSTFGLISPGKGIEYGIKAIAKVAKTHKDILYLILGQTHPCVKKKFGEDYRNKLEKLVDELNIRDNVKFVNKYLTKKEIVEYIKLSDIYMTPYLGNEQAVSGTLAYAAGMGKLIVSTPYKYAEEILGGGRGLLAAFRDEDSLANCIEYALDNPDKRKLMETEILKLGKSMMWKNVAEKYVKLFLSTLK